MVRGSFFFFAALLFLSGCGKKTQAAKNLNSPYIQLHLNETPQAIDPAKSVDVVGGKIVAKLFGTLVQFDSSFNVVPDLAEYEIFDKGKSFGFRLNQEAKFSNGKTITAQDVKVSWLRILLQSTNSPRRWVLEALKDSQRIASGEINDFSEGTFKIINDREFTITLASPYPGFLKLLTMPAASIVSEEQVKVGLDANSNLITSGAYRINKWDSGREVILEPNPYYISKNKRDPIRYQILPEQASALIKAEQGHIDCVQILPEQFDSVVQSKKTNQWIKSVTELNTYYLGFNYRNSKIDLPFRKALAMSLERELLVEKLLSNQAQVAKSPIPPLLLEGAKIKESLPGFNLDQARAQLSNSGLNNKEIILAVASNDEARRLSSYIQSKWVSIGGKMKIQVLDWAAFKEFVNQGKADIFFMSWWADFADAQNFLFPTFHSKNKGSGGNRCFYENKFLDGKIETFKKLSGDDRINMLSEIISHLNKNIVWIPLWHKKSSFLGQSRFSSFEPVPVYSMEKGVNWTLNKSGKNV